MLPNSSNPSDPTHHIQSLHQLYCQLTGQTLPLHYHRQRMWSELLRAGYTAKDIQTVIRYLQREIRAGRRNVGALKLSNLTQIDRFEEDLQISRVRLTPPQPSPPPPPPLPTPPIDPSQAQRRQAQTLDYLRQLRAAIR